MREFVAVDVGEPAGADRAGAGTRPHLTLRFLGEVAPELNGRISARLEEVAREVPPFSLRLEGVGAFPSAERPRVVWVGVTGGADAVVELARRVRQALEELLGADREAFVPHLTLFRVRSPRDRDAAVELLSGARPPPPPRDVRVTELLLKESVLGPRGADHRTIAAFRLAGVRPADA